MLHGERYRSVGIELILRSRVVAGLAVAALAAVVIGVNLGGYTLWDPDESKHAEIAREMLVQGRWLEPTINFEPYHDKPSLFYLIVGLSYRLFGVTELAARLVPALACWLSVLAVYLYAAFSAPPRAPAETGEGPRSPDPAIAGEGPSSGLVACLLLLSSGYFVFIGRFVNLDAPVSFLTSASVLYLAHWLRRAGDGPSIYPFYVLAGLAVLVKGPMALVLTGIPALFVLATGEAKLSDLKLLRGSAVVALIVALWALPVAVAHRLPARVPVGAQPATLLRGRPQVPQQQARSLLRAGSAGRAAALDSAGAAGPGKSVA